MQAQTQLKYEHIAVGLDSASKTIAFVRPPQLKTYIDIREGLTAIWDKHLVKIADTEYNYNNWYLLQEGSDIFKYFGSLLESDYQPPIMMSF